MQTSKYEQHLIHGVHLTSPIARFAKGLFSKA